MSEVICKEVIITTLTRRGDGIKFSPIRCITEVYEKDGTLIAEHDPSPEHFGRTDLIDFAKWCIKKDYQVQNVAHSDVIKWLESIDAK